MRLAGTWPAPAAPQLQGQIRAGLYVGGKGTHPVPGERHLEDMRTHLRQNPPDILLTNYRMLDFLLLRPEDGVLWHKNGERTLQFLVLDELHTYDGAHGTDVAFLIRRLKRRLRVPAVLTEEDPDRNGETVSIDAEYVKKHVGDLAKNADLSRFIL